MIVVLRSCDPALLHMPPERDTDLKTSSLRLDPRLAARGMSLTLQLKAACVLTILLVLGLIARWHPGVPALEIFWKSCARG